MNVILKTNIVRALQDNQQKTSPKFEVHALKTYCVCDVWGHQHNKSLKLEARTPVAYCIRSIQQKSQAWSTHTDVICATLDTTQARRTNPDAICGRVIQEPQQETNPKLDVIPMPTQSCVSAIQNKQKGSKNLRSLHSAYVPYRTTSRKQAPGSKYTR